MAHLVAAVRRTQQGQDRLLRHEGGMAAVETALLMPVVLLFIFGIVETGRAAYVKAVLHFAVQEGSRYAIVDTTRTPSEIENKIRSKFQLIDPAYIDTLTVNETANADQTKSIDIQIAYRFQALFPIQHLDNITISASTQLIRQ